MGHKHVCLLSGGMDSVYLLHLMVRKYGAANVTALTFDYGQLNRQELLISADWAIRLGCEWKLQEMPAYHETAVLSGCGTVENLGFDPDPMKPLLPHKNMVFVSMALAYAEAIGAKSVSLGVTEDDGRVWDAKPEYFQAMQMLSDIQIEVPLLKMDKLSIAGFLHQLGVVIEQDTTSCYVGHACGECGSCHSAKQATEGL